MCINDDLYVTNFYNNVLNLTILIIFFLNLNWKFLNDKFVYFYNLMIKMIKIIMIMIINHSNNILNDDLHDL